MSARPKITICIPHWQVGRYMTICLRSIRKHSAKYNLDVVVVDNGSKDKSLDYLRSLSWIRLIERPEEVHTNWPANVFTAWDLAIRRTDAPYFIAMHSDVFIKSDNWLDPLLREIERRPTVGAAGAWGAGGGMGEPAVLAEVVSVRGHRIRLTLQQWLHISENHDYMAATGLWSWRQLPIPTNSC